MRWTLLVVVVAAACYRPSLEASCTVRCEGACPGGQTCVAGLCRSANDDCVTATDSGVVAPDSADGACFGSETPPFTRICLDAAPPPASTLAGAFSTDEDANCDFLHAQPASDAVFCVKHSAALDIGVLRVTGTRPLLLLGTESITLAGESVLDVASHVGDGLAPSPGMATCASKPGSAGAASGGGGAGGSFQYVGGSGGTGDRGGVLGGIPGAVANPVVVTGGCDGGAGGGSTGLGGRAGKGGGAVYLLSGGPIHVKGAINASGASGTGGGVMEGGGGGGGGSGGMILLDGASVAIESTATIFALGGAGGGGAAPQAGGMPGTDALAHDIPATGGPGGASAGDGGSSTVTVGLMGGNGASSLEGGGGGGGGAGYIFIRPAQPLSSRLNPPAR